MQTTYKSLITLSSEDSKSVILPAEKFVNVSELKYNFKKDV